MQFAISNSSAVENISIEDQTVTVTFTGGRSYDYTVNDVTAFTTALTAAMAPEQSVGRFVNKSCLLYTSPSPRDYAASRMPSSA